MRLNIGCGEFYADSWTNMDIVSNKEVHPDIIGSLLILPKQIRDVDMVYLGHVLEHVPYEAIPQALTKLWTRCRPGSKVAAVGPDVLRAWDMVAMGQLDQETAIEAAIGARRWQGDAHLWACSEGRMINALEMSGLGQIQAVWLTSSLLDPFPVASRIGWQCAVLGEVK